MGTGDEQLELMTLLIISATSIFLDWLIKRTVCGKDVDDTNKGDLDS